jgi:class 3 adenylate cyclase
MGLADELTTEVEQVFKSQWAKRDGEKVPAPEDLKLTNDSVQLDGVVLYADMADSTALVDTHPPLFAAEVYKTFLHCAARIIRAEGGEITAYDGDRVMAVYVGNEKNSAAARTALKINWARNHIVNPGIRKQYPQNTYQQSHVVGVDAGPLSVARTGVRGANDLVWVGRAANHAAKLVALPSAYPTYISDEVFRRLNQNAKFASNGTLMWEAVTWTAMGRAIHRSTWEWKP